MTDTKKDLILNTSQVLQKVKRIAYEIYEHNCDEKDIVIAGIYDSGYEFAKLLKKAMEEISPLKVTLVKVELDKFAPFQSEVKLDCNLSDLENKSIILTDDVLNTGKTLAYSLKPFLNIAIKKIQTAVIVDRHHKSFPISADFTGYSLATTLQEHIEVILQGEIAVYLK
jgi:pyrimidine operon attenuation protein / uracil phosphoribosyltransferase